MKKEFKYFLYFIVFLMILVIGFLVHGYNAKHIKIDKQYMLIDDKTGFALIDNNFGNVLISTPITWYCVSKNYIIGCIGEDLSNKTESYIPTCLPSEHFIVYKNKGKTIDSLSERELHNLIQKYHIKCKKHYIY